MLVPLTFFEALRGLPLAQTAVVWWSFVALLMALMLQGMQRSSNDFDL